MGKRTYIIQAVEESLNILFLLSTPEFQALSEAEISNNLGLGTDKTFRMLKTLEYKNLVRKKDGQWMVAPEIVKISDGFRRYVAKKRAELEMLDQDYISS